MIILQTSRHILLPLFLSCLLFARPGQGAQRLGSEASTSMASATATTSGDTVAAIGSSVANEIGSSGAATAAGNPGSPGDLATSPDTLRLTLEECLARALAYGEEMQLARADHSTAHARYLQARASVLPQIGLNTTYTRQIESIFGESEGGFAKFEADTTASFEERIRALERELPNSGFYAVSQLLSSTSFASKNSWNAALSIRQKLFQGGSVWGSVAAAGHALKAARLAEADRREDLILRVRTAYLNALLADRGVQVARLGYQQSEVQFKRVQVRTQAGSASEFELLQAQVERDNQIPAIRRALSAQEAAQLELWRLCNLPRTGPVFLVSSLLDAGTPPPDPASMDTVGMQDAAMRASGIGALEQSFQARRHAVTVAKSGLYPDLSVFANVSQQAYPSSNLPKRGDWLRDVNAGLTVSWDLFNGFRTKGEIEEAQANRRRSEEELAQGRELVKSAVIQGYSELTRAAADLQARTRTVELAQRAMELADLRYAEGASSMLEVTDVRIAWQLAQINQASAWRDYFVALAQLERYSGLSLFPQDSVRRSAP